MPDPSPFESDHTAEAAALQSRIEQFRLPGIIDVHTHFMPQQVLDKVWAFFDGVGPATGKPWPISYRESEDERLRVLRSFGVRSFSSLNYPHKPDMAQWLNNWSAQFAAVNPDCLHSATFFPEPSAAEYVAEAIATGARIFKVHVQVGAFDPGDALLDDVWNQLQDSGIPIVLHAGNGPTPGPFTGPERVAMLLQRFPRLTLVIAHMGMPDYREFLDLCDRYQRVYLDTTMAFTDYVEQDAPFPADQRARLLEHADRVLFGSDFPNIPYPYLHAVDAVIGLDLGDDWVRRVLHDNASRLLDLG